MNVSDNSNIHSQSNAKMSQPTSKVSNTSYSQVAEQMACPKKEQAVVLDSTEGITVKEYAIAIGKLIGPNNILFISKISQGRVCLYLSSQNTAESLVNTHKYVDIDTHRLAIRPLIAKTKRIILSNVQPVIPNSILENKLKEFGVPLKSKIMYVRAGCNEPGFTHILSFRRQLYICPDDVCKLPEIMQIHHDHTTYYVYVSAENVSCFLCKEEGHLAKHCKNVENNTQTSSIQDTQISNTQTTDVHLDEINTENENIISTEKVQSNENIRTATNVNTNTEIQTLDTSLNHRQVDEQFKLPKNSTKRPLTISSNTSERSASVANEPTEEQCKNITKNKDTKTKGKNMQPSKKAKILEPPAHLKETIEKAKNSLIETVNNCEINFDNLTKFLVDSYGNNDVANLANQYFQEIPKTIETLKEIYDYIDNKTLKGRITRLVKRLQNPEQLPSSNDEPSASENES